MKSSLLPIEKKRSSRNIPDQEQTASVRRAGFIILLLTLLFTLTLAVLLDGRYLRKKASY